MANQLWEDADECDSIPSNVGDISINAVDPEQEPMTLRTAYTGLQEQCGPRVRRSASLLLTRIRIDLTSLRHLLGFAP